MLRPALLGLVALATLTPAIALAEGEACTRDTECAAAELCAGSVCTASDQSLPTCVTEDDCDDWNETCADGVCKVEGVVCRNPAGGCWVEGESGSCECADGNGSGWSGGFDPDNPPEPKTDAELQIECVAMLVESCGETAPTLPGSCEGDVLAACEALIEHENALAEACDEDVPDVNIARIGACCDDFDDDADVRACVLAIEVSDVCPIEAYEACHGGGGDGGALGEGEQAGGADDGDGDARGDGDDAATKGGCRISDDAPPVATAALLVLVAATRRRRGAPTL